MAWMASSMPENKLRQNADESWQRQIACLLGCPNGASCMHTERDQTHILGT